MAERPSAFTIAAIRLAVEVIEAERWEAQQRAERPRPRRRLAVVKRDDTEAA